MLSSKPQDEPVCSDAGGGKLKQRAKKPVPNLAQHQEGSKNRDASRAASSGSEYSSSEDEGTDGYQKGALPCGG